VAIELAESLRCKIAEQSFVGADGVKVPLGFSFGLACYPENGQDANELVGYADVNLFESKHHGGKLIVANGDSDDDQLINIGTFSVLDGLITAIDNKDHYTRKHSENVTSLALAIAAAMGLSEDSQRTLRFAGLLHDVGKIAVPDRILRKPGRLDDDENSVVKQHVLLGEMIIKDIPNMGEILAAVGSHHEHFDGSGYPRGTKGSDIPLLGRILAVADAFSAMTSDRPYRKALSMVEAREEILRASGTQLDPGVVEVFLSLPLESEAPLVAIP
jgi:putative nucleotidyltransferase with HDIG domain